MKKITAFRYVIVTAARNEEKFIENTIKSMLSQTLLPKEWIIVDDGSTDATKDIVSHYLPQHKWIQLISLPDRGERKLGGGVVHAFNHGLECLSEKDYDFLCKLDADLTLPENYFEYLWRKFQDNPRLGISTGCTYIRRGEKLIWERTCQNHTRGMMKVYRRECFQEIGGLVPELGWDIIDDFKARACGWQTRNFKDLVVIHHRPMGTSIRGSLFGKFRFGHIQYLLNYHPLFVFFSGVYRMLERPYITGGFAIWFGYLNSFFTKKERIVNDELKILIRKTQFERLKKILARTN